MCYVFLSVEILGSTTPSFQTQIHDPQFPNQIDASVASYIKHDLWSGKCGRLTIHWRSKVKIRYVRESKRMGMKLKKMNL